MITVKNILNDLVDYAYANHEKLDAYKKFYVEISKENRKSVHGDYHMKTHHIRIFNLYRDDAAIIATTIHELAHHVDYCNRRTTDHQKEFYAVYEHLLKSALDMKLFSRDEFVLAVADASDSNKIRKMIDSYVPNDAGYKKDVSVISVKNAYKFKDKLKSNGYHYNKADNSWEKETNNVSAEKEFLEKLSYERAEEISYEVRENLLQFAKKSFLFAGAGSYDIKDELKADGFFFSKKDKGWKKEGTEKQLREYKRRYPNVSWKLV